MLLPSMFSFVSLICDLRFTIDARVIIRGVLSKSAAPVVFRKSKWNVNRSSVSGLGANECVPAGKWCKSTAFRQFYLRFWIDDLRVLHCKRIRITHRAYIVNRNS
jgi:hypothetical protein